MDSQEYISERLQDQIDWYDKKSSFNQKRFKKLRKTEIVIAACIPFLSGITASIDSYNLLLLIIIGLLGIALTIVAGFLTLAKYQENWIEYRTICETLKKEKYSFQTGINPYQNDDAFFVLVQRVESIISKENTNWSSYTVHTEKKDK